VLVVEDDAAVRALTRHVLQAAGYAVLEAVGGDEALRVATAHTGCIHLLVTDVVMPGLGGRATAERLAERHHGLRVLFVSGYTDDAVIRHGVLHDKVNFLQKPFTPAVLAWKVREVLDQPST
jgi:CheY-like chemotaxis protein